MPYTCALLTILFVLFVFLSSIRAQQQSQPDTAYRYTPTSYFQQNPLTIQEVKLPEQPKALSPFGENPPQKAPVLSEQQTQLQNAVAVIPTNPDPSIDWNALRKKEMEEVLQQKHNQPSVSISPFLDWVKENNNAKEIAKQTSEKYKTKPDKTATQDALNDTFIQIRYPYIGVEEQPPGSSAAVYSSPKE